VSRNGLVFFCGPRRAALLTGLLTCGLCARLPLAKAEDPPPHSGRPQRFFAPRVSTRDDALRIAALGEGTTPVTAPEKKASPPLAAARYEGMAAAGVQIVLQADGSSGTNLRYLWVQTQGPPTRLEGEDRATARVTIPDSASLLEFLLVVTNEAGVDRVRLKIPVEGRSSQATESGLRADAGDDQIGIVGRQITLNGGRSEPRNRVGFRWVQTGGPAVRLKLQEAHIFSFVPDQPGTYRFALLVACGGAISEPDEVDVVTQAAGPTSGQAPEAAALPVRVPTSITSRSPDPLAQFVRSAVIGLEGGPSVAAGLAEAFEAVAERSSLYTSYNDVFSELSRRTDSLVPEESARRSAWIDRLFSPATSRLVEELRKEGLDLSVVSAREMPLTSAQRRRMADVFRSIARGCREAVRAE
jgi:hypothetical protein